MNTPSSALGHERALVLGGGGSTGNAWLIGVVAGLFDAGLDVTDADLIVGTSAGSTAAAQIAGATPAELLAVTLAAPPQQRPGPQIESALCILPRQFSRSRLPLPWVVPRDVNHFQLEFFGWVDDLHTPPVRQLKVCPKALVTAQHFLEAALQRSNIQQPLQTYGRWQVVCPAEPLHLLQKPQALLRVG